MKEKLVLKSELMSGILHEYDSNCDLYKEFTQKIESLIKDLLQMKGLRVHSIASRFKNRESLIEKLSVPGKHYRKFTDITDISGIRIITYFYDEVDSVASLITSEFNIDYANSIDKRALLDPDRFGYSSLHYIARLSPKRKRLTEYKRFTKCFFEIQIRSILQHTWAEIEHDLGYKSKIAVPKELQRRFYQLAGLLELADQDFIQLRDKLSEYQLSVNSQMEEHPELITIDKDSLTFYIRQSEILARLEHNIELECNIYLSGIDTSTTLLLRLHAAGFTTIKDINDSLIELQTLILHFVLYKKLVNLCLL
jgi:putative GTP pyrophosphokinase